MIRIPPSVPESVPEIVLHHQAALGEGPVWDHRTDRLLWVDIKGCKLHAFNPVDGVRFLPFHTCSSDQAPSNETYDMGQMIGTVVPRHKGGVAVALERGFGFYDMNTRRLTMVCHPEEYASSRISIAIRLIVRFRSIPTNRFNDGKCDCAGRFWAGTMDKQLAQSKGALYRLDADHSVHRMVENVGISNGIAWSQDKMFFMYVLVSFARACVV